jgi:hypothetical protein
MSRPAIVCPVPGALEARPDSQSYVVGFLADGSNAEAPTTLMKLTRWAAFEQRCTFWEGTGIHEPQLRSPLVGRRVQGAFAVNVYE